MMDGGKELAANIAQVEEMLKDHPDGELRDEILRGMRQEQRTAAMIAKIIKD
jgi:hypothetical protein